MIEQEKEVTNPTLKTLINKHEQLGIQLERILRPKLLKTFTKNFLGIILKQNLLKKRLKVKLNKRRMTTKRKERLIATTQNRQLNKKLIAMRRKENQVNIEKNRQLNKKRMRIESNMIILDPNHDSKLTFFD